MQRAPITTKDAPVDAVPVEDLPEALPVLALWVRGALLLVACGWIAVFITALRLDPYLPDGAARRMETHRQLGLPPCTFYEKTGVPCPSCGMTSSFALLMHGDIGNSMRANWVGTLLALFGIALLPWCIASVWKGHLIWLRSIELPLSLTVGALLCLLLLRWGIVLTVAWWLTPPGTPMFRP